MRASGRGGTRLAIAVVLACAAALTLSPPAGAAPADLDGSFGSGGFAPVEPPLGGGFEIEKAGGMAVGPSGEIYVVTASRPPCTGTGECTRELTLSRFEADGAEDGSFAPVSRSETVPRYFVSEEETLGVAAGPDGATVSPGRAAVAVQPDGKVVIASSEGQTATSSELVVARYLPGGEPDTGFGSGGQTRVTLPTQSRPEQVLIGADGTITVPVPYFHGGSPLFGEGFSVVRLLPDGQLDPTWAGVGTVRFPTPGAQASVRGAALTPEGGLAMAFEESTERVSTVDNLVELLPDGSLDPAFGDGGRLRLYYRVRAAIIVDALAIDSSGRIVGAGWSGGATLFRLRPDGSAERTFNGGRYLPLGHGADHVYGLGLQPSGRIVVLASAEYAGHLGLALFALKGGADHTRCLGHPATIVGTQGPDVLIGTPHRDVIAGLGGADTIRGLGGPDIICGGKGRDKIYAGPGHNLVRP